MISINISNIKPTKTYLLITILVFIIYGNSINNEYAIDDNLVVEGVTKVEEGFKGIPKIFTTPFATGKQSYGYRPLVQTTFAIEKQFFKNKIASQTKLEKKRKDALTQANISHFFNVVLYAFLCIVLFSLLSKIFNGYHPLLPFVTTFLFLVHPIHTEVVDNLKSRDELLMLLCMLISLKFYLKFASFSKIKDLLIACLFVLLARLSKMNAIALIGIVPVVLYFKKASTKKIIISTVSVILLIGCFILIKKGLVTVTNTRKFKYFENPLKSQGDFMDRITLGLYSAWFYLEMLIFPKNMSFYYGYNQIPLANWTYWQVWAGLLFYTPLGIFGFIQFLKRKAIGLGIVLWIGIMMGVINVFFPIVGIVADRFTFPFSLGFCIVIAYLLLLIFKIDFNKKNNRVNIPYRFIAVFLVILTIYSVRTIARNPDWHDQLTLYSNDIKHLQESAKGHALLANYMYPKMIKERGIRKGTPQFNADIKKLIYHYNEALRIDSTYLTSINNLGSVYMNFLADYPNTIKYCGKAVKIDSNYLEAHFNLAFSYDNLGDYDNSLLHYAKVIELNPNYMKAYESFNIVANKNGKIKLGIQLLVKAAKKSQYPKNIYLDIANLYSLDNYNVEQSIAYFIKAYETNPNDKNLCVHISKLYRSLNDLENSNYYYNLSKQ